jgi:hypothetical protein
MKLMVSRKSAGANFSKGRDSDFDDMLPVAFCASVWVFARVKASNRRECYETPECAKSSRIMSRGLLQLEFVLVRDFLPYLCLGSKYTCVIKRFWGMMRMRVVIDPPNLYPAGAYEEV